jgi:hypothetical protein
VFYNEVSRMARLLDRERSIFQLPAIFKWEALRMGPAFYTESDPPLRR